MRSHLRIAVATLLTVVAASMFAIAPASAAGSTDFEIECTSSGYDCIPAGLDYTGASTWGSYVGARHNCTSLTSWVLAKTGMAQPWAPMGNGSEWDDNAARHGYRVDDIPAVGAIAQWNNGSSYAPGGHVAVVLEVQGDVITIIEDNFSSKVTRQVRIGSGSAKWPSNFVHINDAGAASVLGAARAQAAASDEPALPIAGDFDGDGTDDVLIYRAGPGPDELRTFSDGAYVSTPVTINGTYTPIAGDFDGNGTTDIIWYAPGAAADFQWNFNGDGTYTSIPRRINGTYIPVAGDFDGNGYSDIIWYAPGTPADYQWSYQSDGSYTDTPRQILGTYEPFSGDFDGDGVDDMIWYAPGAAADYEWNYATDGTYTSVPRSIQGTYTPIPGDFDASGTTDVLWYAPGTATDYQWSYVGDGTYHSTPRVVNGTYRPIVGDFDRDTADDIMWFTTGGDVSPFLWLGTPGTGEFIKTNADPAGPGTEASSGS